MGKHQKDRKKSSKDDVPSIPPSEFLKKRTLDEIDSGSHKHNKETQQSSKKAKDTNTSKKSLVDEENEPLPAAPSLLERF